MKFNNTILSDTQKNFQFSQLKNHVILNTIVLFMFILFYFLYLSSELDTVGSNKSILQSEYNRYTQIQKNGLSHGEFVALIPDEQAEVKTVVQKSGEDIFSSVFKNTTSKAYLAFLGEKESALSEMNLSEAIMKRDEKLAHALPFFGDGITYSSGVMTELELLSYLERLLITFNLKTDLNVDFTQLEMVYPDDVKNQNISHTPMLYKLPILLKLTGNRTNIIEFLHFLSYVGSIDLVKNSENGNIEDIEFHEDGIIRKKLFTTQSIPVSNIYEGILMSIQDIKISDYLDSSDINRSDTQKNYSGFLDFIRKTSDNSKVISLDVNLNMYVRGIPIYKKEEYIKKLIADFDALKQSVNQTLQQAKNKSLQKTNVKVIEVENSLSSLATYLGNLDTKVKVLRQGMGQKTNIDATYNQAYEMKKDLELIQNNYNQAKTVIEQTKNIK